MQKAYTNSSDASEDDVSSKRNTQAQNQNPSDPVAHDVLASESSTVNEGKTEEKDPLHKFSEASQEECHTESDPVRILQLSQSVFIPDSLDDDESLIIPPTPEESGSIPFIIPSSPTEKDDIDHQKSLEKEENREDQPVKTDKEADVEKQKGAVTDLITSSAIPPTKKITESPDGQSQCTLPLTEPDFRNGDSEDLTEASLIEKDADKDSDDDNNCEIKVASSEDWCLHLTASEPTQSLQFLEVEAKDEKNEEIEDGITKEKDEKEKKVPSTSSSDVTSAKDKSLGEMDLPEIKDGEPKKNESELLSPESAALTEKPVFLIDAPPEISSLATAEKTSKSSPVSFSKIQSLAQDSEASKAEDQPVGGQDASEEQASKDDDDVVSCASASSSTDLPSLKAHNLESPVPEKSPEAEQDVCDTEKEKSPVLESEIIDSKAAGKEVRDELPVLSQPTEMPTLKEAVEPGTSTTCHNQSTEDLKSTEKEPGLLDEDNKAPLSQSTEKTQSDIDASLASLEGPPRSLLFSYTDVDSFVELCNTHIGRKPKDPESVVSSKPGEKVRFMCIVVHAEDKNVYQTVYTPEEISKLHIFSEYDISPHTSISTNTSKKSLLHSSLTSGELGDISSSLSSKSITSSKSSQPYSFFEASQDTNMMIIRDLNDSNLITSTRISPAKSKSSAQGDLNNKKALPRKRSSQGLTSSSNEEPEFLKPGNVHSSKRSVGRKRRFAKVIHPDGSLLPTSAALTPGESTSVKRKNETSSSSSTSTTPSNLGNHKKISKNVKRSAKKKRKVTPGEENLGEEAAMVAAREAEMLPAVEEDPNLSSSNKILPGVRIMARWKDGYYYPGEVLRQDRENYWVARFDDGTINIVSEESMTKVTQLPKMSSVLVKSADGFFDPGIITGYYREAQESGYIVEQDNGLTKRYPRAAVILSCDQANLAFGFKSNIISPSSAVSLDNIVSGKRKRTPVLSAAASPALRARLKRKAKNPDPNLDSTAESSANEAASGTITPKGPSRGSRRTALASTEPSEQTPKPQQNASSSEVSLDEGKEETSEQSSIVATGKKIFQGYAFLLSQPDKKSAEKHELLNPNSEFIGCSDDEAYVAPIDKKYISSLIEAEGGVVFETFEECQGDLKAKKLFLIASCYLRTIKYMQCLATATPCVQHTWISCSCRAGEVLSYDSYRLAAGYSIMEQRVLEWHDRQDALKGMKILLISEKDKNFVDSWTPVLLAAKAELVQKSGLPSFAIRESSVIDIIVTDASCPKKVLVAAERNRIPVVSSEWVIQCLICGFKLPHDAHPKFKHNYVE